MTMAAVVFPMGGETVGAFTVWAIQRCPRVGNTVVPTRVVHHGGGNTVLPTWVVHRGGGNTVLPT